MERAGELEQVEERWRDAGLVLRRVNPEAFAALLIAAEVTVAETSESRTVITFVDF